MNYRPEIDGLRAIAVLPVLFFHANFNFSPGGFVGVDIFFVISGYLITTILLSSYQKEKSIRIFYERRARRILPMLFLVMLVSLLLSWIYLTPIALKDFAQSLTATALFASNFLFWQESGYFSTIAELKPLLHTWTLGIEEQFYIFYPPLLSVLFLIKRKVPEQERLIFIFKVLALLSLASLLLAQWLSQLYPTFAFYLLPTRGWELGIGSLLALYQLTFPKKQVTHHKLQVLLSIVGLLMIACSILFFDKNIPYPSLYTLLPTMGTALILAFATQNNIVGRYFLGNQLFVGIGLISYSLYLWHQPIFAFARTTSLTEPNAHTFLGLIVLCIALSIFSWRFVEKPFRGRNHFSSNQVFIFSILGITFFSIIGIIGHLKKGFPVRLENRIDKENLEKVNLKLYPDMNAPLDPNNQNCDYRNPPCLIGNSDRGIPETFAVLGDSHAGSLSKALESPAYKNNIKGVEWYTASCPISFFSFHPNTEQCRANNLAIKDKLDAMGTIQTFILSSRWTFWLEKERFNNHEGGIERGKSDALINLNKTLDYKEAVQRGYAETIKFILNSGHKVVLIYPIPEAGWHVPDYLIRHHLLHGNNTILASVASTSHDVFRSRNANSIAALDSIGEHPNLTRIYPEKIFCDTFVHNRCVTQIEGYPLYFDDDHLSPYGASFVAKEIIPYLISTD